MLRQLITLYFKYGRAMIPAPHFFGLLVLNKINIQISSAMSDYSFLYIWILLILLRAIVVPEFKAAIAWDILIDINVHAALGTETTEAVRDLIFTGHFSSVLKVTTNFVHDILQQPCAWMTSEYGLWLFFSVLRSFTLISWIWNLHISYFFSLH